MHAKIYAVYVCMVWPRGGEITFSTFQNAECHLQVAGSWGTAAHRSTLLGAGPLALTAAAARPDLPARPASQLHGALSTKHGTRARFGPGAAECWKRWSPYEGLGHWFLVPPLYLPEISLWTLGDSEFYLGP